MEVEGGRFVGCSVGIEDKPAGGRAHGLTEQLLADRSAGINPESEAVKWSGKLPVLRMGDIALCASSRLASLGLRAICGLLFFAVGFLADLTAFPQGSLT